MGVLALVVFPACLRDEQRHVLLRVVMVAPIPSPLNQRPEAFNRVRMHVTYRIFSAMVDDFMRHQGVNSVVALVLVCDQERVRQADMLFQELHNPLAGQIRGDLGNDPRSARADLARSV